jgi:ketosteroid isomerase-like protein
MGRMLTAGCALAMVAIVVTGCGGSAKASATTAELRKEATLYQIDQVERTFHRAGSTHNVNLMMSLWAPGAIFNIGTKSYTGKAQIRKFFATENAAFKPQNQWESDTPSYKIRITVNGDKATLFFECHYVDVKTGKLASVVGVDHNLQKIDGRWLIVSGSGAPATLG